MDGYFYEQGPYHVVEPLPASGSPQLYLNPNRVRVARGATLERGGGGTANDAYQRSALNTFEDNSRNAEASAPLPSLLAARVCCTGCPNVGCRVCVYSGTWRRT